MKMHLGNIRNHMKCTIEKVELFYRTYHNMILIVLHGRIFHTNCFYDFTSSRR